MATSEAVVNPSDASISGSPMKFPMEPLGDVCLVEKMEANAVGRVIIPEANGSQGDPRAEFLFGKVIAVGGGSYSDNGVRVPLDVKVGDIVTLPAIAAMRISLGLRNELCSRGATLDYIDKVMVVQINHIVAKLL